MTTAQIAPHAAGGQTGTCPYQGLLPFGEDDTDYFFGRDVDREIIEANLIASRLTLLYAASGVGKTSVLLAGVIHDLRELARARPTPERGPEYLPVVVRRWSDDPIAAVDAAAAEAAADVGIFPDHVPASGRLADRLRTWADIADTTILLVLDQFEEFLLYHGNSWETGGAAWEIAHVLSVRDLPVNTLVGLREDALASLDRFKGRVPHLFDNYLRLEHLDVAGARRAIVGPLQRWNDDHPDDQMEIEDDLVECVLDEVVTGRIVLGRTGSAQAPATNRRPGIETPFLQLVLTRLWEEERSRGQRTLRLQTLRTLGGAAQIVHTHLDLQMTRLSARERDVAAAVFHQLVTPSGAKVARSLDDLAAYTSRPAEDIDRVLRTLSRGDWRVVRAVTGPDGGESTRYEVFHDVLADAMLDWRARHEERRRRTRLVRRSAGIALAAAAVVVGALVLVAVLRQQRDDAIAARSLARAQALVSSSQLHLGTDPRRALRYARDAVELDPSPGAVGQLRAALAQDDLVTVRRFQAGQVRTLEVSPDGRWIAVGSSRGRVNVWRLGTNLGEPDTLKVSGALRDLTFSRDGRHLVAVGTGREGLLWDVARSRVVHKIDLGATGAGWVRWAPRGPRFLTAGRRGVVWTVRGTAAPERQQLGPALLGEWSPGGRRVVTATKDGATAIYDSRSGRLLAALQGGPRPRALAFTADGSDIRMVSRDASITTLQSRCEGDPRADIWGAVVSADGATVAMRDGRSIQLRSLRRGCRRFLLPAPEQPAVQVGVSPNGRLVASAGFDGVARVWDLQRRRLIANLSGRWGTGLVVARTAPGNARDVIFTAGDHGVLGQWRLAAQPLASQPAEQRPRAVAFGANPRVLFVATAQDIRRVDLAQPNSSRRLGQALAIQAAAFSADGRTVVAATKAGRLRIRSVSAHAWRSIGTPGDGAHLSSLALNRDGSRLAVTYSDGPTVVWDTATGNRLRRITDRTDKKRQSPYSLFSFDGNAVTVAARDLMRYPLPSGPGRMLDKHGAPPVRAAGPPPAVVRGTRLLAALGRADVAWRDLSAPRAAPRDYPRVERVVNGVAISPDGHVFVTASDSGLRLWDAATGQLVTIFSEAPYDTAAFSPDGRTVLAGSRTIGAHLFECRACGNARDLMRRARALLSERPFLAVAPLPNRGGDARLVAPKPRAPRPSAPSTTIPPRPNTALPAPNTALPVPNTAPPAGERTRRQLPDSASGRFRVPGRHSSATVRG